VIYLDKRKLRREILDKRAILSKNEIISLSSKIINTLIDSEYYKNANTIMTFISFDTEVDTHEFIKIALGEGKKVVVPVTFSDTKELKPSQILSFSELEPGYYDILTPKQEYIRYIDSSLIDLIVVPGVVFDHDGYRVGYGGGYYDRFLSTKIRKGIPTIAIGFDLQIVEKVPREEFDVPVDFIITEKEIISCR